MGSTLANGTVNVSGGTLNTRSLLTNAGATLNLTGGTVNVDGGYLDLDSQLTVDGAAVDNRPALRLLSGVDGTIWGDLSVGKTGYGGVEVSGASTLKTEMITVGSSGNGISENRIRWTGNSLSGCLDCGSERFDRPSDGCKARGSKLDVDFQLWVGRGGDGTLEIGPGGLVETGDSGFIAGDSFHREREPAPARSR